MERIKTNRRLPKTTREEVMEEGAITIECVRYIFARIKASAEENWTPGQVKMLKRLIASEICNVPYDEITEERIRKLWEEEIE